ncbi:MAG TPA: hypothetical protein VJ808_02050 [Gemmatimonadales bacterium]|nr:hypothetical protein [Gemmatimonadales bacterium]
MRNYWMRIALGALAIFIVGMLARALIHRGLGSVKGVVEGSGPLSIPLAFIPFTLGGDKLGTLERVTLERATPRHVTSVELEVELSDSMLARGLEGCQLAANLDSKDGPRRIEASTFWCAENPAADSSMVRYGQAVFHPGDVTVPLYLSQDLVDELQNLDFGEDSAEAIAEAQAEAVMEAEAESALAAEQAPAGSALVLKRRMRDSLRAEGRRRADSVRSVLSQMADSMASQ